MNDREAEKKSGTYALVLSSATRGRLEVGRLGELELAPGVYIYVGSAFGPGGVGARVAHHLRRSSRPHWHIDYLRACVKVQQVFYCVDGTRREHAWAQRIGAMANASIPLRRFGASDCRCESHLYFFRKRPSTREIARALETKGGIRSIVCA